MEESPFSIFHTREMAGRDGQDGRGKWVFGWHLNDTFPASTYYVTKVLLLALNWALKKIENLYLSAVHTRGWPPLRIRNVGMSALPGSWWHLVCVSWPNNKHVKWSPFLADFVGASNIMRKNLAYVKMRQERVTIHWMALKISIFFLAISQLTLLITYSKIDILILNVPALFRHSQS